MTYTPPTSEEIRRVAEYWQRVEVLNCTHPGWVFGSGADGPVCSKCRQPVRILTDIQLEQMRLAPIGDEVRDGLLAQMNRGGVTFAIDGQWHEVRFHAHPDAFAPSEECVCISVENVERLLRATEVR